MCSLCLPSTGDIGTLGAQFLSVNKDSHQLLQGGFLFYKGWSAWNLLFFVRGISSLDHEACQIHWMYYGTFLLPTLLPSSEPSLTDVLACVLFCRLLWDFLYILGPILCYNILVRRDPSSVPTAFECSGYGMGHAWVTEDALTLACV